MEKIKLCEAIIQAVLKEFGCTLVYQETRINGEVSAFQIAVVPVPKIEQQAPPVEDTSINNISTGD